MKTISQRTLLRYPGGKQKLAKILQTYLPDPAPEKIVSPFLGGGGFEVHMAAQGVKIEASDIFAPLVNFWQELLTEPERLYIEVKKFADITQEEAKEMQKTYMYFPALHYVKAAQFYVLNRVSYSGYTLTGGICKNIKLRFTEKSIVNVKNFRAPNLSVRCADYEEAIADIGKDFLFMDPPYHNKQKLYGHKGNMGDFNHEKLKSILEKRENWMLCYNDCEAVREMYSGCRIETLEVQYSISPEATRKAAEVLIFPI